MNMLLDIFLREAAEIVSCLQRREYKAVVTVISFQAG